MNRTKRWASSEHSRVISGVFAKSVQGGDEEKEGAIVQNAAFGLARVRLKSLRNLRQSKAPTTRNLLQKKNKSRPVRGSVSAASSTGDKQDDERPTERVRVGDRAKRWLQKATVSNHEAIWEVARFVDSLYVVLSVPLRIGFFFDPWNAEVHQRTWTLALTIFTALDALFEALRILAAWKQIRLLLRRIIVLCCIRALERSQRESSVLRALRVSMLGDDITLLSGRSEFSARGDRIVPYDAIPMHRKMKLQQRNLKASWLKVFAQTFYVLPWELCCAWLNYNWMHLVGGVRFFQAMYMLPKRFSTVFFKRFRTTKLVQLLSFSTTAIVVHLLCIGMYLCHAAASGYMFLAHWECGLGSTHCQKYPLPQSWVLRDNLERGSMVRKYVRTLYWACKTVTTLGQGDLVPATNAETEYRIIIQFLSGLWATAILTAYSFFFSHKDANMTTNISTRRQQAVQFLSTRKLPEELVANVRTYFQYMERTRNGVEEELILSNLPAHYRTQCSHYVKYKCFRRITIFKNRQGAFLRTVLNLLEKDFFAPNQVVLRIREAEDMLIVAAGEIRIMDEKSLVKGRLTTGNAYAEYALFEDHLSHNELITETYCELWYLTRRSFKVALRKHFSKFMTAPILAQQFGVKIKTPPSFSNAYHAARLNSLQSMQKSARMLRVLGTGSAVMNKMVQKISRDASSEAKKTAAWRQPNSFFQFVWLRIECGLLLLLLAEVPHQVAFQRGFGLLNSEQFPVYGAIPFVIQQAVFCLSMLMELFFYVDLYFRARCFVRPALNRHEQRDEEEHTNTSVAVMISDKAQIFRHYLENDNVWMDVLANMPIALVWDLMPKDWFSPHTTQFIRFVRVLRLIRARKLRLILKTVMLEHGISTHIRLLVYIMAFVVPAAHFAGCLFFLVADIDVFHGGLPAEGVVPGIISTTRCLEDASLFGNCTWYMYDRSTFNIDAPYLRSLHWSLVLLSTVGYGDIAAFTTKECVAACIWIFLGANICYFTSAALSSVIAQLNILDTIHHERVEEINLVLMCMTTVSDQTKNTLRSYYETKWKLNGSAVHDEEVMSHLPRSLRRQVACSLFVENMKRCALFAYSTENPEFVQQLAQKARCEIFLTDSYVIREGHLATEFFIIQSGDAERLLPPLKPASVDLSKLRVPRKGSTIGENHKRQRLATLIAPVVANVDSAFAKLTPLRSVKQSSHGLSQKSGSVSKMASSSKSANLMHSRCNSMIRSQTCANLGESSEPSFPTRQMAEAPLSGSSLGSGDRRRSVWRIGGKVARASQDGSISVSVLKKDDTFGEESFTSQSESEVYHVSVRVLSTIQVIAIRRVDFLGIAARFPRQSGRILERRKLQTKEDEMFLKTLRLNFYLKHKLAKWLGPTDSLARRSNEAKRESKSPRYTLSPDTLVARWWHRITGTILVYNFYMIIFRIAFLPYPSEKLMTWLTLVDYVFDGVLYLDIYLKHQHLGYVEYGQKVLDPVAIRKRYQKGWFAQDCWSMLPLYYRGDYFYMTAARLPRLLRSRQLADLLDEVQTEIQQHSLKGNAVLSNVFDLVKFVLIFVSTAHYIGSLYYLLGHIQLEYGIVEKSWINSDFILDQYPNDPLVHYMRAMYWCLSTFTVDCFGDVLAHNFLEVCFAGFTCILGWIFVGQVIGRINSLMITIDQDAKQRHERVEDFEQYSKQRNLPQSLRLRAMQSLAYKSECLLELKANDVFSDLPTALRIQFFYEMYGSFVKNTLLFQKLTIAQLEAIANVLYVEIYLHGDIIYEVGRAGAKLYIMKTGRAELFAPDSSIVYAAMETGAVFGEFSFFIPGATRLASSRAVRSCQVLQLDKKKWNQIWPREVRGQIESHLVPYVKAKYIETSKTYMNITKNFTTNTGKAISAAAPALVTRARSLQPRRLGKVHPSPSTTNLPCRDDVVTTKKQPACSQEHKIDQRLSLSIKSGALLTSPSSPARRKTMLETTNHPTLATSLSSMPSTTTAPVTEPGSSALDLLPELESFSLKRDNHIQNAHEPLSNGTTSMERGSKISLAAIGRWSSFPAARHFSSLAVFVGAIAMKENLEKSVNFVAQNDAEPHVAMVAKEHGREEAETSVVAWVKRSLVLSLNSRLSLVAEADSTPFEGLSAASKACWRRHSTRLMAAQTYYKSFLRVQQAVSYDPARRAARRSSLAVAPTYYDANTSDMVERARQGFHASYPIRRHSLEGGRKELNAKLLVADELEKILAAELEASLRTVEVTPNPVMALPARRQRNSVTSSFTSRRASELSSYTSSRSSVNQNTQIAAEWERPWWTAMFGSRYKSAIAKRRAKIAPQPVPAKATDHQHQSKYQIWVEAASPSRYFLHNSAFRQGWNMLMLFITLYYIVVIPFRVGFLHQYMSDPTHAFAIEIWFIAEYLLTDTLCVVDFILHRNYFVFLHQGELVSDRQAIAAEYWYRGSFVVDLLSIIPFEILAVVGVYATTPIVTFSGHPPHTLWATLSLCRINRFLRGMHFHSLSDKVQHFILYDVKIGLPLRPSLLYVLRLALDFALGTHWVACLFFGISYLTYDPHRPSWLTAQGMLLFEGCQDFLEVARVPVAVAYLRSFHFSIGAITTVCYGDILPMNAIENIVTLAVIFISVAFFSMLSGGFFKFFERELGKRAEYEEKVAQVGHFMVFHQFPARTWKQMQVYFALSWQESKGMHEDQMLRGLTTTVRQEIALHVHASLLKHVKLFTHTEEELARVIIAALKHEIFVRNDVIIQRGDMGRSLYIIETGLVSICAIRNVYGTASMTEIKTGTTETHRSSVTGWMAQATISLADAQRMAYAGAIPNAISGDGGITGDARHAQNVAPVLDVPASRAKGKKVTQREEKFVKGPFDYFGERSLLFGTPRNATCMALCVCSLFVLTIDRFEAILDEFPWYRTQCIRAWVMNRDLRAPTPK